MKKKFYYLTTLIFISFYVEAKTLSMKTIQLSHLENKPFIYTNQKWHKILSIEKEDTSSFSVQNNTVVLKNKPNFEKPQDSNLDNQYEIICNIENNSKKIQKYLLKVTITNQFDKEEEDKIQTIIDNRLSKLLSKKSFKKRKSMLLYNVENQLINLVVALETTQNEEQIMQIIRLLQKSKQFLTLHNHSQKWLSSSQKENKLSSAQFLYMINRVLHLTAYIKNPQYSLEVKDFQQTFFKLSKAHYLRWFTKATYKGWGSFKKESFYKNTISKQYQKLQPHPKYHHSTLLANKLTDTKLWIASGALELLAYHPEAFLSSEKKLFKKNILIYLKLLKSRLTQTQLINFKGEKVIGINPDANALKNYPDHQYATYIGNKFPQNLTQDYTANTGWDISHARRFIYSFETFYRYKSLIKSQFPSKETLIQLSNQIAYKIFNKNFEYPRFSNYFSGDNGWYRVNYKNRKNFAYQPYDLSIAFPTGGYCFLKKYNPDIKTICDALYFHIFLKNKTSMHHSYTLPYNSKKPRDIASVKSLLYLEFLPTLINIL